MPIIPYVLLRRGVAIQKAGRVRRPYACAGCGHRAEVEIVATARGEADGTIASSEHRMETEAHERADAALADEMQDLIDLVPCPACGGRSENAGLYRQNTVLMIAGALILGALLGGYAYLGALRPRSDVSPMAALIYGNLFGIVPAGAIWYRRRARVARVATSVQFLPGDGSPPRSGSAGRKGRRAA